MNIFDSINNLFKKSSPQVYSKNTLGDIEGIGSNLDIQIKDEVNDIYGISGLTCASDVSGTGFLYFFNPPNSGRIILIDDMELTLTNNGFISIYKLDQMLSLTGLINLTSNVTTKYKSLGNPISKAYIWKQSSPYFLPSAPIIERLNLNAGDSYPLNLKSPIVLEMGEGLFSYQENAASGQSFTFNINFRERKK